MPYLLAWGNNLTGSLDPVSGESIIHHTRHVLQGLCVDEIVWSSWASTIARGMSFRQFHTILTISVGNDCYIWGSGLPGQPAQAPTKLSLASRPAKFLGADEATAYLDKDGFVRTLPDDGTKSSTPWQDVVLTGLGHICALSTGKRSEASVCSFNTIEDLMASVNQTIIAHPLLNQVSALLATDSRIFALTQGPLCHLLEISASGSAKLVEDLEGLGLVSTIPGSANRLAVITEAGDAYMIPNRSLEPDLLEIEDESTVRFVGVGSKHEVVVTEENVWVRGESECP